MWLKTIRAYLVVLALTICQQAFAKPVIFPVLIAGEVTYSVQSGTPSIKLQTGVKLTPDNIISIPEGGYVALLQNNTNLVECDKPGEHSVSEILRTGKRNAIPLLNKYYLPLYKKLSGSVKSDTSANNSYSADQDQVVIDFPADTYLIDSAVTISWHPGRFAGNYLIEILNSGGTVIYSSAAADTTISFQLDKLQIKPESMFQIIIRNLNIPGAVSVPVTLVRYNQKQTAKIVHELSGLLKHPQINSPVNQLALAQYYEKYRLINRAHQCFQTLYSRFQNNPGYRGILSAFREEHFIATP